MKNLKDIALRVAGEVTGNKFMAIFPITDFAEALLAEIAKENEPVGYIQNGKLQWNTNGGPDKWRKRKDYTGAIYAYPPSTEHIENRVAEACAVLAETPVSGEQDDITMAAKDRIAKSFRRMAWKEYLK